MAKSAIIEATRFLGKCLRQSGLNVSRIILFGSQSTGAASEESDIDVLIVSKDFRGKDIFERVQLVKDAEVMTIKKFLVPLDTVTMTPEEFESDSSLTAEYAKSGEVITGADG